MPTCPVCGKVMITIGSLSRNDDYDKSLPVRKESYEGMPFFQCNDCRDLFFQDRRKAPQAYQRILIEGKWYYFKDGRWNFLRNIFPYNPSKRYPEEISPNEIKKIQSILRNE